MCSFLLLFCLASCPKQGTPKSYPSGAVSGPIPGDRAGCNAAQEAPCPAGLSCITPKACPKNGPCKQDGVCRLRCSELLPCPEQFACKNFESGQACVSESP